MPKSNFEAAAFLPVLLQVWESRGHDIGVDQHLRVWQLLKSQEQVSPHQLKLLLSPILGYNPQLQASFYQTFDTAYELFEQEQREHELRVRQVADRRFSEGLKKWLMKRWLGLRRWTLSYPLSSFLFILLLALGATGYWWWQRQQFTPDLVIPLQLQKTRPQERVDLRLLDDWGQGQLNLQQKNRPQGKAEVDIQHVAGNLTLKVRGLELGREEVKLQLCQKTGECVNLQILIQVGDFGQRNYLPPDPILRNPDLPLALNLQAATPPRRTNLDRLLGMGNQRRPNNTETTPPPASGTDTLQVMERAEQAATFRYDPTALAAGNRSYLTIRPGFSTFTLRKGMILAGLTAVLLLVGWWRRYRRRRVRLAYTSHRQGPYHWLMRIPGRPALNLDKYFYSALVAFKARDAFQSQRLAVDETVEATIRSGGNIQLAFQEIFKQEQFLLLIDLNNTHQHQRQTFELLIDELIREEAPIKRFYFAGDPRICWEKSAKSPLSLSSLAHRYGSDALLVYSNGQRLLEYRNGRPAAWSKLFLRWPQRLLLLPEWNEHFSRHEQHLNQVFRILPASTRGLAEAVSVLEAINIPHQRHFRQSFPANAAPFKLPPGLSDEELMLLLKVHLITYTTEGQEDDTLLRWIAACAIPAAPFWGWTLLVGRELSEIEVEPVCTLSNLDTLNRLPWLADNQIPEAYRMALVEWLEERHPVFLLRMRQRWAEVLNLEENLPPIGSLAWDDHHIALTINELFKPDLEQQRRQQLEQELEQLLHGQQVQDAMVIKYVKGKSFGLDHRLFKRFKHLFVQQEKVVSRWRDWTWQVPIVLVVALLSLWTYHVQPVTTYQVPERIKAISYASNGQDVLVASNGGDMRYLSQFSNTEEWVRTVKARGKALISVATDESSSFVLSASQDYQILVLDDTLRQLGVNTFENRSITDVDFHPYDPMEVLISFYTKRDGSYRAERWNLVTQERLAVFPHENTVSQAKFSRNGEHVLTASQDKRATLWTAEGEKLVELPHPAEVTHVALDPLQRWLITGCKDDQVRLWSWKGEAMEQFQVMHNDNITTLTLSNSGTYLLTGSRDKDLRQYTVPGGQFVRDFNGHRAEITSAVFAPDESVVVSGDAAGVLKFWHLE